MESLDFYTKRVNYVVERPNTANWNKNKLCSRQDHVMVACLNGEAYYRINEEKLDVKKNDVYIFSPGSIRSGFSNPLDPWHFIAVNFTLFFPSGREKDFEESLFFNSCVDHKIIKKIQELSVVWSSRRSLYEMQCRNLINEILYLMLYEKLYNKKNAHWDKLDSARSYIQENFTKELSVEQIAHDIGLSVSHFRKLYSEAFHISPKQYIMELRLNKAYDLLNSGEVNVTEAAMLCGFSDVYYFSALFKRKLGISPTKFLLQHH